MSTLKTYGFGEVAKGFYNFLEANNELDRLKTIIIKNPTKKREAVKTIIETTNKNTIRDKDIDVLVELISSSEEAYGIVAENLEIGKKVISANKKLIAQNLSVLIKKEKENKATFLYEGAVCGSIPIIRILNDFYANEPINEIKGVFNGSSNYILSQLFNTDIDYKEALIQAQNLGFAEADPTSDVGGFDALYKLVIVTAHAFGKIVKPEQLLTIGIQHLSELDIAFAKNNGLKIKLIAKAKLQDNQLSLSVLPTFINDSNELFYVENEYNGVLIDSKNVGEQFYKGKGAGSLPTGSVVYADLKAIDNGYSYNYKKLADDTNYTLSEEEKETFLFTVKQASDLQALTINGGQFYPVDIYGKQFVGKLSIKDLIKNKSIIEDYKISVIAFENEEEVNQLIDSKLVVDAEL